LQVTFSKKVFYVCTWNYLTHNGHFQVSPMLASCIELSERNR